MIRWSIFDEVRLAPVLKDQFNTAKKRGLVVLDGEVIEGNALCNQIVGQLALRVQSIGGDGFIFQINGIKKAEWPSRFYWSV